MYSYCIVQDQSHGALGVHCKPHGPHHYLLKITEKYNDYADILEFDAKITLDSVSRFALAIPFFAMPRV